MNFGERSEIKSFHKMVQFLESERIGRFATIDKNGFPFIAPMNFVFFNSCFYVHGFPRGEKFENIKTNSKCGFEVDKELAFLPSYFFEPPTDASKTDTLYISIVAKGIAELVIDNEEKSAALNALMEKSQLEGGYERLKPDMATVKGVGLIKIKPQVMTGKYKLGRFWDEKEKLQIATRMMKRAVEMPQRTLELLNIAGLLMMGEDYIKELAWVHTTELIKMMGFVNQSKYPEISLYKVQETDW
jgi:nitroimidazol reductase NimA-like FMN-containing flavoprotein (pyridoxamine 5'-phosphate oxidase superfamily)